MQQGIIPKAFISSYIDGLKDLEDFLLVQEPNDRLLSPFLWEVEDCLCLLTMFRMEETNHFSKGLENGQTVIPCLGQIFSLPLQMIKE